MLSLRMLMTITNKAAVLTGDVIASSSIAANRRKKLLKAMEEAMLKAASILPDFKPEIFQGDSFQGYTLEKIAEALRATLFIIMYMRSEGFGIRVSTGIGNISFESGSSLTSDGTAFHHSGRNMEVLKKKDLLLAIGTDKETLQNEWNVHTTTLNFLLKRCTPLQAAALLQMLEKKTQQEAATNLQVKQPAIQQRLQAVGWPVIQTILARFELQF
ncbi:hypothetical protein BH10BAC3_BH10BAC3_00510 [soil metagenome]